MSRLLLDLIDRVLYPTYCCGVYSIFALILYLTIGAFIVGYICCVIIIFTLRSAGINLSKETLDQAREVSTKLADAALSKIFYTMMYAGSTIPLLVFAHDSRLRTSLFFLITAMFLVVFWFIVANIAYDMYLYINSTAKAVHLVLFYFFALLLMSNVLISGSDGGLGLLSRRWYGVLNIFFPVTTAVVTRVAWCAAKALYRHAFNKE